MSSNDFPLIPESLPTHVAIIMDGNGRWARKRAFNRIRGHKEGTESVRDIVKASCEIGVKVLTLYAFSTENWKRPALEVSALMNLLKSFLKSELSDMMKNSICLNTIGNIKKLPNDVFDVLCEVMDATRQNQGMILNLALSYGGRHELARAARHIANQVKEGQLEPDEITEEILSNNLYTHNLPDPDVLIRTSGEMRVSNFLLFQIAYSEIFVTKTLWPDFRREEFIQILSDYQKRERRFGLTGL